MNKREESIFPIDRGQLKGDPFLVTGDMTAAVSDFMQSATRAPDESWSTGFDTELLAPSFEAVQSRMSAVLAAHPDQFTLDEVIGGRTIARTTLPILAGTLPYTMVVKADSSAVLSENTRLAAQIELHTAGLYGEEGSLLLSRKISLPALGDHSLNLASVPAMAQDAATWDSYTQPGAQEFPAYLIRVKSRLTLDGETMVESTAMGVGQDLVLKVSLGLPGQTRTATFRILSGDAMAIGIDGGGQSPLAGLALGDRNDLGTAAGNLYATSKVLWTQQDFQDRLLARFYGVVVARLPSAGIFATPLSVVYNFGIPSKASYHSRQVDIKLGRIAAVALDGNPETRTAFIIHSGMLLSSTEGAAVEEVFSKPLGHGSNTLRLLQLANQQKIPIYHLTAGNVAARRAELQHPYEVLADIDHAVNAGMEVIIPQTRQTNGAWYGSGYILLDPKTGSADYRVSGGLSGNFDNDECQRSTQPIKVALPDIALIWSVLFAWMIDDDLNIDGAAVALMLSNVVTVSAVVRTGAYVKTAVTATGTLVKQSFQGILVALFGLEVAEAAGQSCDCEPEKRRSHLGGNDAHNMCADAYSEDEYKKGDVKVAGKNYDALDRALSPPGTLYEIKTGMAYSRWKHGWWA